MLSSHKVKESHFKEVSVLVNFDSTVQFSLCKQIYNSWKYFKKNFVSSISKFEIEIRFGKCGNTSTFSVN